MIKKGTVMIIDDQPIVRDGLAYFIGRNPYLEVVATAEDGEAAQRTIAQLATLPDLLVVDIKMPKLNGAAFIKRVRPKTKIVVYSSCINFDIAAHMPQYGVHGYLLKRENSQTIIEALVKVINEDYYMALSDEVTEKTVAYLTEKTLFEKLSSQQLAILTLIAQGKSTPQIAASLLTTEKIVSFELDDIYTILNVTTPAQAVAVAIDYHLISPDDQ